MVLENLWSLGGQGRNKVNEFGAQHFINYKLSRAGFVYTHSSITADWTADSGARWTVPVAGGIGKVFKVGGQSMSASLQGIANVTRPDDSAAWAVNFQRALLLP